MSYVAVEYSSEIYSTYNWAEKRHNRNKENSVQICSCAFVAQHGPAIGMHQLCLVLLDFVSTLASIPSMTSAEKQRAPQRQLKRLWKNIKIKWNDLRAHNHIPVQARTHGHPHFTRHARARLCIRVGTAARCTAFLFCESDFCGCCDFVCMCWCVLFLSCATLNQSLWWRCGLRFYINKHE